MYTLITIAVVLTLSLVVLGGFVWIMNLSKKDISFTELAPDTGKIVKQGANVAKFLFNSKSGRYDESGEWISERQNLGVLFNLTGRVFFGMYPIYEIFKFNTTWTEFAEGKRDENGKQRPPSVTPKTENGTTFKRYYTHAVMVSGAEMGKESGVSVNDTSTTRIDAVMLVTIEITNIHSALYKLPPEGIVFAQADTSIEAAFNDYVKGRKWETFREESKASQDSAFVTHILSVANPVLSKLDIGMKVTIVELKYYDLTPSPGNEELEKSQTALLVAENDGAAAVALANKKKEARRIEGEGEAEALREVAKVIGEGNIAAYANLGLVGKTQLRVYGGDTKNAVPIVETGDKS